MVLNRTLHLGTSWGGAAWAPTDLGADLKIWLEADDTANLKQLINGTTDVTAANDRVGYIADLSGNGNHIIGAADDTTRPQYQTTDYNHVNFAGTQLLLRTSGSDFYNNGSATFALAVRPNPSGATKNVFSIDSSSSSSPLFRPAQSDATTASTATALLRNDAGSINANLSNFVWGTSIWTNTDIVLVIVDTGTAIKWYVDGAQIGTDRSYTRAGTLTVNQFCIGGGRSGGTQGTTMVMRFSGALCCFGDKTAQIADITTYLAALQGRSI